MADKILARKTYLDARRFMIRFGIVSSSEGLIATPNFKVFTLSTVEHLMDATSMDSAEIVVDLATPISWKCDEKHAVTANQAIEIARQFRSQLRSKSISAKKMAADFGWPDLTGSPKQVIWAESIRATHEKKVPGSQYLKNKTAATWWIENRNVL